MIWLDHLKTLSFTSIINELEMHIIFKDAAVSGVLPKAGSSAGLLVVWSSRSSHPKLHYPIRLRTASHQLQRPAFYSPSSGYKVKLTSQFGILLIQLELRILSTGKN